MSDGYFSADELLRQWNSVTTNPERKMVRFLESPKTKEFIEEIARNESQSALVHYADIEIVKTVKGRNTKNGRTQDEVYMHPYLFLDFCMWINVKFKYKVIKFVQDELIKNRHLAGDNYRSLSASASKFKGVDYINIAKGLNWIVFNKHYKSIRDYATDSELNELHNLEDKLAFAIDMGLIKTYDELITTMRKMYNDKYQKF